MATDFEGVVLAAGRSTRFGGELPKQFQDLGGSTVLERSIGALSSRPAVKSVVIVMAAEHIDGPAAAAVRARPGVAAVVAGGATRAESVMRGLEAVGPSPFLLIHDAARPLASPALVDAVIAATRKHGAAVPVLPIHDTVKSYREGWVGETVQREGLRLAQTPQGARADWLREALERARREGLFFSDEAGSLEQAGRRVAAVQGDPENRKITTPADLQRARDTLGSSSVGLRVGSGYDVHRVDPGRPLMLGGIHFAGEAGLAGHSDADVVLHAAMDALLGAAGLGDIGVHFPPEDPRFAGSASTDLAREVAALIEAAGYEIVNLDLTLLAEAPKIRSRSALMRAAIAECLGIEPDRVGLKATTLEGLGALGRREGIGCQAVAMLSRRRSAATDGRSRGS